jgi:hypothetical protein
MTEAHDVVVIYARGHTSTTPAFVGACSCGWRGLPCSTRHDAGGDADRHREDYDA